MRGVGMQQGWTRVREEPMGRGSSLRTKVTPNDVFLSWRTTAKRAAMEFSSREVFMKHPVRRRQIGFFAIGPRERLELQELQSLERAGLRVVHVPTSVAGQESQAVANYLASRIARLRENTTPNRYARSVESRAVAHDATNADALEVLVDASEEEQLEAINDPDNAIDDLT
ncbi:hypothetical protein D621_01875 [beta proteobacterium AAP51]|nr:hypothetical protein D621_01875 [beta proteobacterium AAP51]